MAQEQEQEWETTPTNGPFWFIIGGMYIGMLILFGWQTWQFVNFLFPEDQLLMKVLTLISFDIFALIWACTDLFFSFASRAAKHMVKWAWGVTFVLSLVASILYLVIQSFFRFHVSISPAMVDWGLSIAIFALTFDILCAMFFLYLEWNARHPHRDQFTPRKKASNKIQVPEQAVSNKFEDMQISPNTGPMPAMNGQIKKKPVGNTQTS